VAGEQTGTVMNDGVSRRREVAGFAMATVLLVGLTVTCVALRRHLSVGSELLLFLLVVVLSALIGGAWPSLAAAVAGALLINYYLLQPVHQLTIHDQQDVVALVVFVASALLVSRVVDAAAPLVETDRQRTALLNAVSHDLRTPLASAKAAVSSLRSEEVSWTPEQTAEWLAEADRSLDRLTNLVTNLLDLSRLQAGVMPVLVQPVGLDDVVSAALRELEGPQGMLTLDVSPDLPEVQADPGLLQLVISNLLHNAQRHGDGVVEVSAALVGSTVQLRVIDRGRGIPTADHVRAFTAFEHDGPGVGLGLPVARGLATAMGGSVDIEASAGGGATLVVTLRVAT
jgi:two-component system sensor histidine kinase KdpD